jgi:hypothetical protein
MDTTTVTTVTIPWGDWVQVLLPLIGDIILMLLGLALTFAATVLPKPVYRVLMMLRAEQLLKRAVDYGLNATDRAAHGKKLEVSVANSVVYEAANYAVDAAEDVVKWLGGETKLVKKLYARLDIEEDSEILVAGNEAVSTKAPDDYAV